MKSITVHNSTFYYEHVPLVGSGNNLVPQKYITKLYIPAQFGHYLWTEVNGELTEEQVKASIEEQIQLEQVRKYGTQQPVFRKNLKPHRVRH